MNDDSWLSYSSWRVLARVDSLSTFLFVGVSGIVHGTKVAGMLSRSAESETTRLCNIGREAEKISKYNNVAGRNGAPGVD